MVAVRARCSDAQPTAAVSGRAKWPLSGPDRAVPPARPRRSALDIQPPGSVDVPGGVNAVTVRLATRHVAAPGGFRLGPSGGRRGAQFHSSDTAAKVQRGRDGD
ncbi:hypothetical protein GCM10010503_37220 [Streptomyces lucensis JCM 4490]|uniref:Uncharacterized protein n=1 Tax=Streptomyces lucensis JCM 4490 TaxID=1306176 RepID=A0A918J977_9ACTN|nr:hypothetical protein GCM10010503_37220 [Streptomyces lucensis JCM 4490]